MVGPFAVVQVVEFAAQALVPYSGATQRKTVVRANREAGGIDGTSLWGLIELELIIRGDITGPAGLIFEAGVGEGQCQRPGELTLCMVSQDGPHSRRRGDSPFRDLALPPRSTR